MIITKILQQGGREMGDVYLRKINNYICNELEEKYFKQFNVYDNFQVNCEYVTEKSIEEISNDIKLISVKIIDTFEGTSLEGQHLTGKKLVIMGNLCTKIFIKCPKKCNNYCCVENKIPFSTFIIVPKEICLENPIYLDYMIEDATIVKITDRKIFLSITLFIEYRDDY